MGVMSSEPHLPAPGVTRGDERDARAPSGSHRRANVLGVGVHATDMASAVRTIEEAVRTGVGGYVCVTGVHGVMEAQRDENLKRIINDALLVTPDGMPTVWVGKLQGHERMERVYGPDLMLEVCRMSLEKNYSHFIYGGNVGVAEELAANLREGFPGIRIVGTFTPPFRPLNDDEERELTTLVSQSRPDIFWVGLSTPKQERLMADLFGKLDTKVMIGVGAAFDVHTGRTKDAPAWVKQAGLQWLHRLLSEPRRLAGRYFNIVPRFIFHISLQLLGVRKHALDTR